MEDGGGGGGGGGGRVRLKEGRRRSVILLPSYSFLKGSGFCPVAVFLSERKRRIATRDTGAQQS